MKTTKQVMRDFRRALESWFPRIAKMSYVQKIEAIDVGGTGDTGDFDIVLSWDGGSLSLPFRASVCVEPGHPPRLRDQACKVKDYIASKALDARLR